MPATAQKGKSLATQKVKAYLKLAEENEGVWAALIIFMGALFLLGAIPFYPVYIVPILALICAAVAFKHPAFGVLLSVLIAFPAVSYQSAIFGWVFLLVIAIVLFEMLEQWLIIAYLEILIMAPFSFGQLPFFGWISILGMALGAMRFGSKKSTAISIPAVFAILLLSSLWGVQNSAFLPLALDKYLPLNSDLSFSKPAIDILALPSGVPSSLAGLFDFTAFSGINSAISQVLGNMITILTGDSGLVQLVAWGLSLYAMAYLSGNKGKHSQLFSSFVLFLIVPVYFLITSLLQQEFHFEIILALAATSATIGVLEQFGVKISHEVEARRTESMKSFGKFGLQDLGMGAGEQSLADVGNYDDVKKELQDAILLPLENKELSYAYGIKPPAGILLFGPPGTGKTMLMRALAKELKYGFYYVKSSDILSQWYGESEKNVSEIFNIARSKAPALLFFDEIDSIGKKRTSYSADDVGPRVLSVMLQEMDGLKTGKSVMVVGATNVPHQLDPALLRPGRFDKIIYMHLPEKEGRLAIFKTQLRKLPVSDDIDLNKLAMKTERFSGADIANVVQEAVKLAAKEARDKGSVIPISMNHFLTILKSIKPSTGIAQLENYETFKLDFERRVGAKEEVKVKEDVVTWDDVAGLDDVRNSLLETIEMPLIHEKEMKEFKIKPTKGILLFGPPGTGKTLIVKAASNELKSSFQSMSGAELLKQGYSEAVGTIKDVFNRARENTPAIIFVDEIETLTAAAARSISGEILGQFLVEMDGIKELKGVVVMAATNKPSLLDPAILRPGRFDKIFYIPPPNEQGRFDMFKIHLGSFAESVDCAALAKKTDGFTGADIAGICQEMKMIALKNKLAGRDSKIKTEDLLTIISRRKPSVTKESLREFDLFMDAYGERR